MTPVKRVLVVVATSSASAIFLSACCGASTVPKADVEKQAAVQLAKEVDEPEPDVTCPDDLDAEVDATLECTLVAEGDTVEYPVTITVTSVKDRAGAGSQVSLAVGLLNSGEAGHSIVSSGPAPLMAGAVASTTVMVWEAELLLPQASVAVHFRVRV